VRCGPAQQRLLAQPPAKRTIINNATPPTATADAAGYSNCDHPSTCVSSAQRVSARQASGKHPATTVDLIHGYLPASKDFRKIIMSATSRGGYVFSKVSK